MFITASDLLFHSFHIAFRHEPCSFVVLPAFKFQTSYPAHIEAYCDIEKLLIFILKTSFTMCAQ